MKKPRLKSLVSVAANRFTWTYFLFALFSRAEEGMMGGKADKHLPPNAALPHEKSAFVLFTKSFVSKYFPPLYQDHFFSHVALHNKRKLVSCVD